MCTWKILEASHSSPSTPDHGRVQSDFERNTIFEGQSDGASYRILYSATPRCTFRHQSFAYGMQWESCDIC